MAGVLQIEVVDPRGRSRRLEHERGGLGVAPQVADEPAGEERAEVDAVGRLALAGDHRCGLDEVGDDRSEQGRQDCSTYRGSRTTSGEMFHLR
ncbi:hypothetical protein [Rhodococcus pyridinivorans]|uniref:hypothetical protein n=1 Tax=Rhodococcus pyridinivorans TaxID=103816 RepID=UPI001D15DF5F|nr:hypothetical protein [Rhodococcus pyridinivorans]